MTCIASSNCKLWGMEGWINSGGCSCWYCQVPLAAHWRDPRPIPAQEKSEPGKQRLPGPIGEVNIEEAEDGAGGRPVAGHAVSRTEEASACLP
ncbi:UNVERIFIED_CONTAM: hypothetical protein K2H54_002860 [Gekko kuhli]